MSSKNGIKTELREYLDEKKLNSLFVTIVEAILTKKPQCPIDFMVNFLLDKYPNETSSIEKRFEKETPMSLVMAAASNKDEEEELSESEEEEEEEEEVLSVEEERSTIQDTMFLIEHADGDVIIRQGDEDGDKFYCIDSGVVDIFINDGEERKLVKTCQAGDSFGELALLYGAPRAASCIASGDVRLWTLDRISFKRVLMKTTIDVRTVNKSFLEMVPLFSNLDEYELLTISDALHEESFEDSQAVLTEGEAGDKFYLIKEGNVVCTKRQRDGSIKEVKRLTTGEYFGELALLTDKPRQATVTAEGSLTVLWINRETFNNLVCIKELLVRNMGTYNI
ncbi:putative cAMP-dependent protein kinase regulatory subunit [Skeletonema marinoi]|uniref:cAMP-dependent protein kinase regulatory subunit n=1 Tax=Skeletonema marinoi TaxID=267567 RepID=A0AAD8YPR1_9STRA|nr:putative cAMP-dependent protein kinase regulatory subunit [Skeletonema marinoi]